MCEHSDRHGIGSTGGCAGRGKGDSEHGPNAFFLMKNAFRAIFKTLVALTLAIVHSTFEFGFVHRVCEKLSLEGPKFHDAGGFLNSNFCSNILNCCKLEHLIGLLRIGRC